LSRDNRGGLIILKPKIKFIGFDSMGTRSMATVVYTSSYKIFIDPGVSYAPRRYGLPPHEIELEKFNKHLEMIHDEIIDSDIIIISHYHRDHYLYREGEEDYYRGKIVYLKHPTENINHSQRIRAYILLNKMGVKDLVKELKIADGLAYNIDKNLKIIFSNPVPHGEDGTPLGYVIMTLIEADGFRIVHASDVQGPICRKALDKIISWKPNLLVMSGPPTYFEGYRIKGEVIDNAIENLLKIMEIEELDTIILDHHLLRDLDFRKRLSRVYVEALIYGKNVLTAAEYMGMEINQLEARRKELWRGSH